MKSKFDSRWVILLVIIVSVVTTTIIMNNEHTNNNATKVTNTIEADNGDLKINWEIGRAHV